MARWPREGRGRKGSEVEVGERDAEGVEWPGGRGRGGGTSLSSEYQSKPVCAHVPVTASKNSCILCVCVCVCVSVSG